MNPENIAERLPNDKPQLSKSELIEHIAEPMREYALANPLLTFEKLDEGIKSLKYGKILSVSETTGMFVLLTVSPSDKVNLEKPFWHCSMSHIRLPDGKPKKRKFWTKREFLTIKDLLPKFIGERRGVPPTDIFSRTKLATHCYRELTAGELLETGWFSKWDNQEKT